MLRDWLIEDAVMTCKEHLQGIELSAVCSALAAQPDLMCTCNALCWLVQHACIAEV
jgi:hypothetical protein